MFNQKKLKIMKKIIIFNIAVCIIPILLLIGEIRCFYKMINCNWEPVGKAEILYTVGTITGTGEIIGWFDIKDY